MPYEIISDAEGCGGFAVVKEGEKTPIDGGCHETFDKAHAQFMALDAAYEEEMEEDSKPIPPESEPEEEPMEYESRAVDISAPEFMRESARRGIRLHEEGLSGDGLKPQTVEDARAMASGTIAERKWRKISPWIARHTVDLEAIEGDEITAGLVAMLLWGGGSSKASAKRAQDYAERVVAQLDKRNLVWIYEALEERAPAPKSDQIKGSDTNPAGSAKDKSGSITINATTETALKNKVKEHNDAMKEDDKPTWTRVTLGALKSVYRRGAGAFSTSHRPGIGRAQWAMARVNAFLVLSRTGSPKNPKYVSDNDLLNPSHPKYSKSERAVAETDEVNLEYEDSLETERESSMTNEIEVRWVSKSFDEKRCVAYTNLELRAEGEGSTLVGYAAVFDSPSEPMPFIEYVKRGAFMKTIKDGADVRLLIDHEGVPLARTKSGTLLLEEDERGLRVEANLDPSNPDAARVMSALKRGDLSQMSFAFRTIKDSFNADRSVRELKEVQLYDVSVVTYPAYESTVAELRTANETTNIEPSSFTRLRSKEVARARISQPK